MTGGKFAIPDNARAVTDSIRDLVNFGINSWYPRQDCALLKFMLDTDELLPKATVATERARVVGILAAYVDEKVEGDARRRALALLGMGEWAEVPLWKRKSYVGAHYPSTNGHWDGFRKEPFDRFLLSLFIHLEGAKYGASELVKDPATPASDYEVVQYFSRHDLASGEATQYRLVRALTDGVSYWEAGTRSVGRNDETVSLVGPGSLTRHSEGAIHRRGPGRSYYLRVDFPHALMKDQEFEFTLLRREVSNLSTAIASEWVDERSLNPKLAIRRAKIEIVFPLDRRPRSVWAFENLADWLSPGTAASGTPLVLDSEGVSRFSWSNPTRFRSCGIGWEW